jgi:hypothetical protein
MAKKGNRSVKTRDITGSQVITGDNNRASMRGTTVTLPPPESVDLRQELAALQAALAAMQVPERGKLDRALQDATEEAARPKPEKDEIGGALDRVVRYAKGAGDFAEHASKLQPILAALASALGVSWHFLAG